MIRKIAVVMILSVIISLCFLQFYHFLKKRIVTTDFKSLTENRLGEFLHARVRVSSISVGLIRHISVKNLEIDRTKTNYPFLIGVKKIDFRYDFSDFFKRNFKIPQQVFLDSPRLVLQAFQSPDSLFETSILESGRGIVTRFDFEGGEIDLPAGAFKSPVKLVHIQGHLVPVKGNVFRVSLRGSLEGILNGDVSINGTADPVSRQMNLTVNLLNIRSADPEQIPFTELNGTLEFKGSKVEIEALRFKLRGIPSKISGVIDRVFSDKPAVKLEFSMAEGELDFHSALNADFQTEALSGTIRLFDEERRFSGVIVKEPNGFRIPKMTLDNGYEGAGQFDFKAGTYWVKAQQGKKRFHLSFSNTGFSGMLFFQLDHVSFFGFDLVTYGNLEFKPQADTLKTDNPVFDLELQTDYLIFQYELLRDFELTARLSRFTVEDITAHWGRVSELRGKILFKRVPEGDLVLRAGPISLKELHSFGSHPLPASLGGMLEGKLNIQGALAHPELNGTFVIRDGTIGELTYDLATLHFTGNLPYLVLEDSKVTKGKNNFLLKGGLDFSLKNFLQGTKLMNSEQVVIWKGLTLSHEIEEQAAKGISSLAPDSSAGLSTHGAASPQVNMEYRVGDRTSVHMIAKSEQDKEEYLTVGPKVKF